MNRRELLVNTGIIGLGFLNEACTSTSSNPEVTSIAEDYKKRAISEINLLPQSEIKQALQARVVPLLQAATPLTTKLSGVDILFESITIDDNTVKTNGPMGLHGTYTSRKNLSQVTYKPVGPINTSVPLIGIVRPNEISKFPSGYVLPDGTPIVKFHWDQTSGIDKSLSPVININVAWDGKSNTIQTEQALRSWGYIKESCSFLLDILMLEATIAKMQQLGIQTNFDTKDQAGNVVNIPVVPESRIYLVNQKGRSMAMLDLAGYIVSLKAFSKTPTLQQLVGSGTVDQSVLPSIDSTSLGTTERDILLKSFEWVLSMPNPKVFSFVGDLDKLP